jgi:SH3-like domain-containing protein
MGAFKNTGKAFGFNFYFSKVIPALIPMRQSLALVAILLLALLFDLSCGHGVRRDAGELDRTLDSLKTIYAPDTRVAVWTPVVARRGNMLYLDGEVDQGEAYHAIQRAVGSRFPGTVFNLTLLPGKDPDRVVNGLVKNSVINLRAKPGHRSELVTQALLGMPIRILKEEDGWCLVQLPNRYLGWVEQSVVRLMGKVDLDRYRELDKIIFTRQYGQSYKSPDRESQPVSDLVAGCILPVLTAGNGFYQVIYPDSTIAWLDRKEASRVTGFFPDTLTGERLVETAMGYMGVPYLWGGTSSKGVDCSGLTFMVYFMNGTILERDASQQCLHGRVITTDYEPNGLLPGDLLFFGRKASDMRPERVSHVAIYAGDGEFIHASENLGRVGISSMDSTVSGYIPGYRDLFIRAVRIAGESDPGFQPVSMNPFFKEIIHFEP